jgi:ABC-type phosphate transport system substrate-binding protein
MMALALALVVVTLAAPRGSTSQETGVVVVLNARNPTKGMSMSKAKQIYLGQTAFWHGTVPIKVYARPGSSSAGQTFYQKVLGMNAGSFTKHWTSRQLSGKGVAPQSVGQAEDLASKIRKAPGSIGFMLPAEAEQVGSSGLKFITLK